MSDFSTLSTDDLLRIASTTSDHSEYGEAVAELVTRHKDDIYTAVHILAGNKRSLAEDVFQQTFLNLFLWIRSRGSTKPLYSFPRLLRKFTKAAAIDLLRKERSEPLEGDVEAVTQNLEETMYVREILESLPDRDRRVLELTYFEGYNSDEIAELMHVSAGAVRTLRHRALKRIERRREEDDFAGFFEPPVTK